MFIYSPSSFPYSIISLILRHLIPLLLISTSISILMASSLPNTTHPEEDVAVSRIVVITASGGEKFEVQSEVMRQLSETIRQMIDDRGPSDEIVLSFPNITGEIMAKVVEYCNKHAGSNIDEMKAFDTQLVDVHYETVFDIIRAADHLNIKSLLNLTCQTVADMMKGKTPKEIRKTFNIKDPSTPEEEEEMLRENAWAFV